MLENTQLQLISQPNYPIQQASNNTNYNSLLTSIYPIFIICTKLTQEYTPHHPEKLQQHLIKQLKKFKKKCYKLNIKHNIIHDLYHIVILSINNVLTKHNLNTTILPTQLTNETSINQLIQKILLEHNIQTNIIEIIYLCCQLAYPGEQHELKQVVYLRLRQLNPTLINQTAITLQTIPSVQYQSSTIKYTKLKNFFIRISYLTILLAVISLVVIEKQFNTLNTKIANVTNQSKNIILS